MKKITPVNMTFMKLNILQLQKEGVPHLEDIRYMFGSPFVVEFLITLIIVLHLNFRDA